MRIIQFLGYFPVTLEQTTNSKSTDKEQPGIITKFIKNFSSFFFALPMIFYNVISLVVIFGYFSNLDENNYTRAKSQGRGTYYFALAIKSGTHLFTSVFVKTYIFAQKGKLSAFYSKFLKLLESVKSVMSMESSAEKLENSNSKSFSLERNRFQKRFTIEWVTFLILITAWSVELVWVLIFVYSQFQTFGFGIVHISPPILGYYHSIFPFLIVYFMNWYLEMVLQIKILVENKLMERQKAREEEFQLNYQNFLKNMLLPQKNKRLICGRHLPRYQQSNSSISTLFNLYNQVGEQAEEFNKIFRVCIIVDMAHSLLRIVFSGYFIASLLSRPDYEIRYIVQNVMTILLYFYLFYFVAKKGTLLARESASVVEELESLVLNTIPWSLEKSELQIVVTEDLKSFVSVFYK